jgi:hypothetical protein
MKYLFFIVVLANLAFFLWELQNTGLTPQRLKNLQIDSDKKQIWLLSELKTEPVPAKNAETGTDHDVVAKNKAPAGLVTEKSRSNQKTSAVHISIEQDVKPKSVSSNDVTIDQKVLIESKNDSADIVLIEQTDDVDLAKKELLDTSVDQTAPTSAGTEMSKTDIPEVLAAEVEIVKESIIPNAERGEKAQDCIEVGPFVDKKTTMDWFNSTFPGGKREKHIFSKEIEVVSNYLVYFPAAESDLQSKADIAMLKQKGITDLWLFRQGDLKGAISLGMFRQRSRAEKLVQIMKRKNLEVSIAERFQMQPRWFVRLKGQPVTVNQPLVVMPCGKETL